MTLASDALASSSPIPEVASYIIDVNAQNFMQEVVETSLQIPVLVYFTAPWSGPCKLFGPLLEKVVTDAKGRLKLAKVDVDKEPEIAQQFRIQSVPMVYVFVGGQPADGFSGALQEDQLRKLLSQFITATPEEEMIQAALVDAALLLASGDAQGAAKHYQTILQINKENVDALAGLASCLIILGDATHAEALLNSIPEDKLNNEGVIAAKAALSLAQAALNSAGTDALQAKLASNPDDHEARFELAVALFASGKQEAAIDALLTIISKEKDWNEGSARKQLLTIFEALGFSHPLAQSGRRKLSAILFR
jgi:putative thioredoxin